MILKRLMVPVFCMKNKHVLTCLATVSAVVAFGGVRTTGILEPTSVLKKAHLWVDASVDTDFTTNAAGGVTAWAGRSDSGNGATASEANAGGTTAIRYGTVGITNGVPAYLMGDAGSGIDMSFTRTTSLRAAFWAMDIASAPGAFFLGDTSSVYFHRMLYLSQGGYPYSHNNNWPGSIWCDGTWVSNNRGTPVPTGLHVFSTALTKGCDASCFSQDRKTADGRNGGRALSELVLFNEDLSDFDRRWIENYLRVKWMDATTVLSAASVVVSYPNLVVNGEAAITVNADSSPQDGSKPLVIVAGTLAKGTANKVRLTLSADFFYTQSRVILSCGAATGITGVSDFEVTGIPAGLELSWTGTQLVAAPSSGVTTKTLTAGEVLDGPYAENVILDRGPADKVRIAMPRTLATYAGFSCSVLTCVGSKDIALSDFEVDNLPSGARLAWNGHALIATYPQAIAPDFLSTDDSVHLWLDVSDSDSLVLDSDHASVTAWTGRGISGNGATASAANAGGTTAIRYGTVGITNGVPAYLMGNAGSGIDMSFTRTTSLRAAFWAMDIASAYGAFFLGDTSSYHFHRMSYTSGGYPYSYNYSWPGSIWCDGALVSDNKLTPVPTGLHVFSTALTKGCDASCFSQDRTRIGDRNGGRALSELILVNRALDESERLSVEGYLMTKWKRVATTLSEETPVAVGAVLETSVQLDAGGALSFGALPKDGIVGLTIRGKLCRGTADKIRITFPVGTKLDRPATLFTCATTIGVTADDFEITGLDGVPYCCFDGYTLTVSAGTRVLEPTAILKRAHLWLDAAVAETFTTNAAGGVTAWAGRSDSGNGATASEAKTGGVSAIRYGTVGITNGVPAYLMGDAGSGIDMSFTRTTSLRTAFWAMEIASAPGAFFLGDTSSAYFHRVLTPYQGGYPYSHNYGWPGSIWCDGALVSDNKWTPVPTGLHVFSTALTKGCDASCFSQDRKTADGRNGGRALSELVLFNEDLSDFDRRWIENYLRVKWMDETATNLTVAVNAPSAEAVFPALNLADGAAFTLTGAVGKKDPAIVVAGRLTKSASGKIVIDANEQNIANGATVLVCGHSSGVYLSDFDLTSFGDRRFSWDGQSLKLLPKRGLVIVFR